MEFGLAGFVVGLAVGYFAGRWVQRRRAAGMTPEQILAEAKARAEEAAAKLKK